MMTSIRFGGCAAIMMNSIIGLVSYPYHYHNTSIEIAVCLITAVMVAAAHNAQQVRCRV